MSIIKFKVFNKIISHNISYSDMDRFNDMVNDWLSKHRVISIDNKTQMSDSGNDSIISYVIQYEEELYTGDGDDEDDDMCLKKASKVVDLSVQNDDDHDFFMSLERKR